MSGPGSGSGPGPGVASHSWQPWNWESRNLEIPTNKRKMESISMHIRFAQNVFAGSWLTLVGEKLPRPLGDHFRPSFPWTEQMQKLLLIYTLSMVNKVFFTRFGVLCWFHTGSWPFQVNGTGKQPGLPSGHRMCRSSLEQRIKNTENLVF